MDQFGISNSQLIYYNTGENNQLCLTSTFNNMETVPLDQTHTYINQEMSQDPFGYSVENHIPTSVPNDIEGQKPISNRSVFPVVTADDVIEVTSTQLLTPQSCGIMNEGSATLAEEVEKSIPVEPFLAPLSEASEQTKKEKRKAQNRVASNKYRQKKKDRLEKLSKEKDALLAENKRLKTTLAKTNKLISDVTSELMSDLKSELISDLKSKLISDLKPKLISDLKSGLISDLQSKLAPQSPSQGVIIGSSTSYLPSV